MWIISRQDAILLYNDYLINDNLWYIIYIFWLFYIVRDKFDILYSENIDKESLLKQWLSEEEIQKYLISQIQK